MPKQATGSARHRLRPEPSFDSSTPATAPPAILADAQAARFDFVIVGAGTAGSVLAARLTEQPDVRVLLLEAGPADGPERMSVPGAWPTLIGSEVDWRYTTVPQPGLGGAAIPYPRGRVLGGSSAINAMFHLRPPVGHRFLGGDGCDRLELRRSAPVLPSQRAHARARSAVSRR